jgi:uncharacterized protein (TIGR03083 family)
MPDATADHDLVERLAEVWASLSELGAGLSADAWKRPTDVPGWSVQDNLAHITGTEAWLLGRSPPAHTIAGDLPHVKNDIGKVNEVFIDSRRGQSGTEALAEFREVTGARVEALRAFGPDDFARESWTPLGPGAVRDLLPFRIFDSWVHEQDIRSAVATPGDFDTAVGEVAVQRILDALPYIVGKKAAAPDGATVTFALMGSGARTLAIGVDGKRAKLLDSVPASPTTTIVADLELFTRVACGRIDPAVALEDERLRVEGDQALGRSVVAALNIVPF